MDGGYLYPFGSLLAADHTCADGKGLAPGIWGALGTFQVGWRQQADAMSDWVIESIQETVISINKAERALFFLFLIRRTGALSQICR